MQTMSLPHGECREADTVLLTSVVKRCHADNYGRQQQRTARVEAVCEGRRKADDCPTALQDLAQSLCLGEAGRRR